MEEAVVELRAVRVVGQQRPDTEVVALGLEDAIVGDPTALTDASVAGAHQRLRVRIDRAQAVRQFSREKVVESQKVGAVLQP